MTELVLRTNARPLVESDQGYIVELVIQAQAGEVAAITAL
jgi:hypothetical protein